jgi:hypothetical protein
MDYRVADYPMPFSVLFALVFFRWHHAVVHCVGMKHYRNKVEEKETKTPTGRCKRGQQHEDSHRDCPKHPEKADKLVSFVNMSQAWNDTKDNRDGVARFAFRRFSRATRPITSVAASGIFRQQTPAVWTGHFISRAWLWPSGRCVSVLYAHFNH